MREDFGGTPLTLTRVGCFETRREPLTVILSAAKDLRSAPREILSAAKDDTSHLAGSFPKQPTRVSTPDLG
jgi:hypothetical protein